MECYLLWQHEFYFVLESDGSRPPKPYVYQAIEFRKGSDLPDVEKGNMSRKQLRETWVLGVAYAPAIVIRKWSRREKGYSFFTENSMIQMPEQDCFGNARRLFG